MNWFTSFPFTLSPWVLEDTNHAWKALELTNLMMITWKNERRCVSSTGGTCTVLRIAA